MTEIENEIIEETKQPIEEIVETPQRVNAFCVIEKIGVEVTDINGKKHEIHDIQTNSSWGSNPYGDCYAVVPDDMVAEISETRGFCDITLNEDGTEVVGFTAREIPEIPEAPKEPTAEERIAELEEEVIVLQDENIASSEMEAELLYELSLMQLGIIE